MSDPEPEQLTRREIRRREQESTYTDTDPNLPPIPEVIAQIKKDREAREENVGIDDLDFPTTDWEPDPELKTEFMDGLISYQAQPTAFPAPVQTDHLIATEHQHDESYREIYPPLDEAELEPTLPHQGEDVLRTMDHDFAAEIALNDRDFDGVRDDPSDEGDAAFTTRGRMDLRQGRYEQEFHTSQQPIVSPAHQLPSLLQPQQDPNLVTRLWARLSGKNTYAAERFAEATARGEVNVAAHEAEGPAGEQIISGPYPEPAANAHGTYLGYERKTLTWKADEREPTSDLWDPEHQGQPSVDLADHTSGMPTSKREPTSDREREQLEEMRQIVAEKPKNPASHRPRSPKFEAEARKSGVSLVQDPHTVSTTYLARILLYIGAILMTGLSIYGTTGIMMQALEGTGTARNLVYAIAPAIIAIVFIVSAFALQYAKEDSRD